MRVIATDVVTERGLHSRGLVAAAAAGVNNGREISDGFRAN